MLIAINQAITFIKDKIHFSGKIILKIEKIDEWNQFSLFTTVAGTNESIYFDWKFY